VANLSNVRGRVEADPLRIPMAASMTTGRREPFEAVLRDRVAHEQASPRREHEAERAPEAAPVTPEATVAEASEVDEPEALPRRDDPNQETPPTTGHRAVDEQAPADTTEDNRRGEPVRQTTAGKGTDSPRTPSATAEPLVAAAVQHRAPQATPVPIAAQQVAATAIKGGGEAPVRGVDGPAFRADAPKAQAAAQAGYATRNAASAELLEQARDSVFKQILMHLDKDGGGELRMRLEPPDLGELDLRLVVDGGNRLTLAIAAERADVAHLLHRHLEDLKHALQQSGLDVAGAEVQTRSQFAESQRERDAGTPKGGAMARETEPAEAAPTRRRGYVTAEGLDFWA
jgi:flagellar hook-length control protein FliK